MCVAVKMVLDSETLGTVKVHQESPTGAGTILCKRDLSLIFRPNIKEHKANKPAKEQLKTNQKNPGIVMCTCNPSSGEGHSLIRDTISYSVSFSLTKEKKRKGKPPRNNTQGCPFVLYTDI